MASTSSSSNSIAAKLLSNITRYGYKNMVPYINEHDAVGQDMFKTSKLAQVFAVDTSRAYKNGRVDLNHLFEIFGHFSCHDAMEVCEESEESEESQPEPVPPPNITADPSNKLPKLPSCSLKLSPLRQLDIDVWCNKVVNYHMFTIPQKTATPETLGEDSGYILRKCKTKSELTGISLQSK